MTVKKHLWGIFVALHVALPTSAIADTFAECANTQVGTLAADPKTKTLHSDCTSNNGASTTEYHWALSFEDPAIGPGAQVRIQAWVAAELLPSPLAQTSVGTIPLSNFGLQNMGPGYGGDCSEASATNTSIGLVDGEYYCGWGTTTSGAKILLKAVNNKGSINDFSIRQNSSGVSVEPSPVPMWGMAHLVGLMLSLPLLFWGVHGARARRRC